MVTIAPASFDIHLPREGRMLYPIGVGCCCFIHAKAMREAILRIKRYGSRTFFILIIFPEGTGEKKQKYTMKIAGIILLIFAILNFIVVIVAAGGGASEAAGAKMSAALLLGVIGGVLYYFGNKKKKQ